MKLTDIQVAKLGAAVFLLARQGYAFQPLNETERKTHADLHWVELLITHGSKDVPVGFLGFDSLHPEMVIFQPSQYGLQAWVQWEKLTESELWPKLPPLWAAQQTAPFENTTLIKWQPISELPEDWRDEDHPAHPRMLFMWDGGFYDGWPRPARLEGNDDGSVWETNEFAHTLGGVKLWAAVPRGTVPGEAPEVTE